MFPGTAIPTAPLNISDAIQVVQPTRALTDLLSKFKPGQQLAAEILSRLPNGNYRALITQREVTLALPFLAKPGDTLELNVVDTKGQLTLAMVAKPGAAPTADPKSTTTTLSQTAQFIGTLLPKGQTEGLPAVALNGGKPIAPAPPATSGQTPQSGTAAAAASPLTTATDVARLAPLLQKAVSDSGLFYESHQAEWVTGKRPLAALRMEPQGVMKPLPPNAGTPLPNAETGKLASSAGSAATPLPGSSTPTGRTADGKPISDQSAASSTVQLGAMTRPAISAVRPVSAQPAQTATDNTATVGPMNKAATTSFSSEAAPLVQQQLNAFATGIYSFHGLAWPGQRIEWEILENESDRNGSSDDDAPKPWKTRLHLSLPSLGAIDVALQITGNDLSVELVAPTEETRLTLRRAASDLQQRLSDAGLRLSLLQIEQHEANEDTGPTEPSNTPDA